MLNESLRQAIVTNDTVAASKADDAFHQVLIQRSANPDLIRILYENKLKLRWLEMIYFMDCALATASLHEHKAVLAALQAKKHGRAMEALKVNWDESLKRVLKQHTTE